MWAVLSYSIGQSVGIGLFKLLPIYILVFFLSFKLLDNKKVNKFTYQFIPLFVIIITITFGSPKGARHFYQTITNQEYTLTNVFYYEIDDFHEICQLLNPAKLLLPILMKLGI